jgi:hypothetical protein
VALFKEELKMNGELGPRSLKDMLVELYNIYKQNCLHLLAIVAIVEIILRLMWSIPDFSGMKPFTTEGEVESLTRFIPIVIMLMVASIMGLSLMQGALIHAISERYCRQRVTIGRAFRFAWERLAALTGAMILAFFAVMGIALISMGLPAGVSSGAGYVFVAAGFCVTVYLMVRWSFILHVALLERRGPFGALARSSQLVSRNWWRVMNMTIVVGIITVAISVILGTIPTIGPAIGNILATPVFTVGITLLYYDLRVRKESYDLTALAGELHLSEVSEER